MTTTPAQWAAHMALPVGRPIPALAHIPADPPVLMLALNNPRTARVAQTGALGCARRPCAAGNGLVCVGRAAGRWAAPMAAPTQGPRTSLAQGPRMAHAQGPRKCHPRHAQHPLKGPCTAVTQGPRTPLTQGPHSQPVRADELLRLLHLVVRQRQRLAGVAVLGHRPGSACGRGRSASGCTLQR